MNVEIDSNEKYSLILLENDDKLVKTNVVVVMVIQ